MTPTDYVQRLASARERLSPQSLRQFTYHAPSPDAQDRLLFLRDTAQGLVAVIEDVVPASPDRTVAIRKVREAIMTANAAIVLEGR